MPADAELIEIYGIAAGEELRLAAHLLSYDDGESLLPVNSTLVLEGGQQLSFNVQPQHDAEGQCTGATVTVAYRETAPSRAASRWLRRQRRRLFGAPGEASGLGWKPALAFTTLAALGAALLS